MCGDLKKEIKVLKFKVTRLNNKMAKNQKQWAETLQELQQESHQHDLQQDCGKSFFLPSFRVGSHIVGGYNQKNNKSEHKLQQKVHTYI